MSIYLITLTQKINPSKKITYTDQIKKTTDLTINDIAFLMGKEIIFNVCTKRKLFKLGFTHLIEIDFKIELHKRSIALSTSFTLKKTKSTEKAFFKLFEGLYTIIDKQTKTKLQISSGLFDRPEPYDIFKDWLQNDDTNRKSPEILTPMGGAVKKK